MNKKVNDELINEIPSSEVEEIRPDPSQKAKISHPLNPEFLRTVIKNHNTNVLNTMVNDYDPHNVSQALERLDPEDMLFFFKAVKTDLSAEVFTLLDQDNKERVVEAFSSEEFQAIVDEMQTDDLVDFVDELPANLVNKVLKNTPKDDKDRINAYLKFKDDSAGTIMTPEYLSVKDTSTVKEAISKIREVGKGLETIWAIFVVDSTRRLVGTVRLDNLLESDDNDIMKSVMSDDFVSVSSSTDQEAVIKAFRKYDISVLPVTNEEDRMLGIITFDDVIDVANTENTEDIQLSAGVIPSETPYLKKSIGQMIKSYAIWLVALLFLDTFICMTLSYLEAPLAMIPLLIAFLTAVMGTNSNAADQTTTVIIREIALGNVSKKNYWTVIWKETKSALITGGILAIFSFGWTMLELKTGIVSLVGNDELVVSQFFGGNADLFYLTVSGVISLSFMVVIVIAKLLGVNIPLLARALHIDPAVMSQPMISTILDIVSIVIYLGISMLLFSGRGL
ncbi:MAG: magnesium transporter [Bacilli bacterium]